MRETHTDEKMNEELTIPTEVENAVRLARAASAQDLTECLAACIKMHPMSYFSFGNY